MQTHKACAPGSRKGIRTSADIIPTLLAIVSPPQGKRLHGVLLEFLILTAIGHSPELPTLATPALLEQVMYYRGPEGAEDGVMGCTDSGQFGSQPASLHSAGEGGLHSSDGAATDGPITGRAAASTGAEVNGSFFGASGDTENWTEGIAGAGPMTSEASATPNQQLAKLSSLLPNTFLGLVSHNSLSSLMGLSNFNSTGHLSLPDLSPFQQMAAIASHAALDPATNRMPFTLAAPNRDSAPPPNVSPHSLTGLSSLSAAITKLDSTLPPSTGQDNPEPKVQDIAQIYKSLREPIDKLTEAAAVGTDGRNKRTLADLAAAAEAAMVLSEKPSKRVQQMSLDPDDDSEWRMHFKDFVAFVQQRTSQCGAALPRTGALGTWCSEQLASAVEWLSQGGMPDPLEEAISRRGSTMTSGKYEAIMSVAAFQGEVLKTEAEAFDECIWKLKRFVEEHRRLPHAGGMSGIDSEAELARWCTLQRRLALRLAAKLPGCGAMDATRVAQLLDVPGWIEG
jgi:hypothetical protein